MSSAPDDTLEARVGQRWNRIPRRVRITLLTGIFGGASFTATILPFLVSERGHATVEIAGALPTRATVNVPTKLDVSADNTSNTNVDPLCVKLTAEPAVRHLTAVFQGLDHVAAVGDRVCGGILSGSETVSIHLEFTAPTQGATTLRFVVTQADKEVGPARRVQMLVERGPAG